nr:MULTISPECIES: IMP dehydrogenase [Paenibacillus]
MHINNSLLVTFDDVLLVPRKSEVFGKEIVVSTVLAPHVKLNIPFISLSFKLIAEISKNIGSHMKGNEISKLQVSEHM